MRRVRTLLVSLVLAFAHVALSQGLIDRVESIARDVADAVQNAGYRSVAVIDPLGPSHESTAFGRFVAEELSGALVNTARLRVIDRLSLQRILDEQVLSVSGLVSDADAVQRVGDLAGVEVLVVGTYFVLESSVRLSLKALNVQTAENVAAVNTSLDLDASTAALIGLPTLTPIPPAVETGPRTDAATSASVTHDSATGHFYVYDLCDDAAWIEIAAAGPYSTVRFQATPNATMRFRLRVAVGGRSAFEQVHGGPVGSARPLPVDVFVGPNPASNTVRLELEKFRQYSFHDWLCQGVVAIGPIVTE